MASKTRLETHTHPLANCCPRGDRVVVKRDMSPDKTTGGILLPDSSAIKQQTGVVYAVGPGWRRPSGEYVPLDIKVGDRVIITGYAGLVVNSDLNVSDADEFIMLREEDILAILN